MDVAPPGRRPAAGEHTPAVPDLGGAGPVTDPQVDGSPLVLSDGVFGFLSNGAAQPLPVVGERIAGQGELWFVATRDARRAGSQLASRLTAASAAIPNTPSSS